MKCRLSRHIRPFFLLFPSCPYFDFWDQIVLEPVLGACFTFAFRLRSLTFPDAGLFTLVSILFF